ncbi:MAG: helix-turn-helix transcriptional regulator [Clostridia bacterium]|nr:helix-turn-helix transcriptional regulator [Clostridia bacterium]
MDINNLSPYIRVATESKERELSIRTRCILDYELMSLEEGELDITYDGKKYRAVPGDILLFHPGVPHSIYSVDGYECIVQPHIHFDMLYESNSRDIYVCFKAPDELTKKDRAMLRDDILGPGPEHSPFVTVPDKDRFYRYFHDTITAFTFKPQMYEMILKSKMLMLLTMIIPENFPSFSELSNEKSQLDIQLLKNYIDENFASIKQLNDLSNLFKFNKNYIIRRFKWKYGVSPIKYISQLRIDEAKRLLSNYSVKKVSAELSYSSVYVFSRAFSKACGMSPSEYKRLSGQN